MKITLCSYEVCHLKCNCKRFELNKVDRKYFEDVKFNHKLNSCDYFVFIKHKD